MTGTEFWLAYQLASRSNQAPTTQLIELDFQNQKLFDLEDVLDYGTYSRGTIWSSLIKVIHVIQVFHQGYVEARFRPLTRWERKDGQKVKTSQPVEDLLKHGVGKTPESALQLIVGQYTSCQYICLVSLTLFWRWYANLILVQLCLSSRPHSVSLSCYPTH